MAITQTYLSGQDMIQRSNSDKIIINHLSYLDSTDIESMIDQLVTVYNSDIISAIPSCSCGNVKGRYLIGTECQECSTTCTDPKDKKDPVLWFESLDQSIPFITTSFWNSLSFILSSKVDYLRWLSDPQYNPPTPPPPYIISAKNEVLNGERSYYQLVNNLPNLIDHFINSSALKTKTTYKELFLLKDIIIKHRDDVISNYLPTPNSKLLVVENTAKGQYTNLVLGDIIDVITMWIKAAKEETSFKKKSSLTAVLISKLGALYKKYYDKFLLSKPGAIRKHIYGARSHFTFRTVIVAAKGKHRHDEITVPWLISVTTFRPHVLNKLLKRGYSYKEADNILNTSVMSYHPVIDEIQDELIKESHSSRGIPILAHRNPGLLQGSIQYFYIIGFNKNPDILATTFSPLSAKAPNADYDGDIRV